MDKNQLVAMVPKRKQKLITDEVVQLINDVDALNGWDGEFHKRVIDYSSILDAGKWKISDYIKAVEFASYYMSGDSQVKAWKKTFPDRFAAKIEAKVSDLEKNVEVSAAIYFRGELVQKVLAQSTVPIRVFHNSKKHEAIEKLASLMRSASSEKVQMESANALLTHLKDPDESKIEIDMNIKEGEAVRHLENAVADLVMQQKLALMSGAITLEQLGAQRIVREESEEAEIIE